MPKLKFSIELNAYDASEREALRMCKALLDTNIGAKNQYFESVLKEALLAGFYAQKVDSTLSRNMSLSLHETKKDTFFVKEAPSSQDRQLSGALLEALNKLNTIESAVISASQHSKVEPATASLEGNEKHAPFKATTLTAVESSTKQDKAAISTLATTSNLDLSDKIKAVQSVKAKGLF